MRSLVGRRPQRLHPRLSGPTPPRTPARGMRALLAGGGWTRRGNPAEDPWRALGLAYDRLRAFG
ncbi:hypothetical protein ACFYPC_02790 [Streptomyces sp. NPDC005808]|uniref:hypothetical protein n=1 Tax=Streptomyces sp. NPDC005808 TaxID=3364734 RepID=UPI003697A078